MATEALPCSISISWKETQNVLLPNEPERKQQTNGQIQRSVCEQWNTVGAQSLSRDNEACANNGTLLVLSHSVVTMQRVRTMECCWCSVTQSCLTLCNAMEWQHARLPCPSPSPGVCPNSCPLNWWCHPTISSSVTSFSSCRFFTIWATKETPQNTSKS